MSHLEALIAEYYDWKGYLVKRNTKVGKLPHGGWAMELDIVAYHPTSNHLVHVEPSVDAHSWAERERRFKKKFDAAREYLFSEVFNWLDPGIDVEQVAVLITHPKHRERLAGGRIVSIDELMAEVRQSVINQGVTSRNAIPEQYPMLRSLQLSHCGYYRVLA